MLYKIRNSLLLKCLGLSAKSQRIVSCDLSAVHGVSVTVCERGE